MPIISSERTSIFDSSAQTLACPVNCVGAMGAGLALSFVEKWPALLAPYRDACRNGDLAIGKLITIPISETQQVLMFPTKNHFKNKSRIRYIIEGMEYLIKNHSQLGIASLALPPLGCGLGGLEYRLVRVVLQEYLEDLPFHSTIHTGGRSGVTEWN